MRLVLEEITVQVSPGGRPHAFTWRGRRYPVMELLDGWSDRGEWWKDEPDRDYFRVSSGHVLAELYREDRQDGLWWLSQVAD